MSEAEASFDPLVDRLPSRFVVGIDLGTTNCAVTYIDTQQTPWQIRVLSIPQLVAAGQVEPRDTLPSFHYQPATGQASGEALRLPWHRSDPDHCVGVMAREEGAQTAGRGIASAKSWLCHAGVDRTANLLPWHAVDDVRRMSPVEASSQYLAHIRDAWDDQFPDAPLADQDIVITLPASFDEVARELTVRAARQANLPRVVLIEEPQAAFYAWVYKHQNDWQQRVDVGQTILVCDIGGGTSDFTLIRVRASRTEPDQIQFHRVAVGEHLILGGDNLDLALAKHLEQKLTPGKKLPPRQWDLLLSASRAAKEQLLGEAASQQVSISLPSGGSRLIASSLQTDVTQDEVRALLVDGFLPECELTDAPTQHASGFQEFGLPYATDSAITRYLSTFLTAHRDDEEGGGLPDVILFNGGFFASPVLRAEVLQRLEHWLGTAPTVLDNDRLDLAVARGAAYYGMVRRGEGVKIAASLARSYYIGVDADAVSGQPRVVCLVPGGAQPGETFELDQTFQLTISQPVEFPLYVSSIRLADQLGQVLPLDVEQMTSLPPVRTVLRSKNRKETGEVSVRLRIGLTEIGTIDLSCHEIGSNRSWKLQFDVRSTTQTDTQQHVAVGETEGFVDEETWSLCRHAIAEVFDETGTAKPAKIAKHIAQIMGSSRNAWPMSLLRRIWEALMDFEAGRHKSAAHEARWLNLLGYSLRPGYGLAVDDWRVAQTWRTIHGKLAHHGGNIQTESLILWRRIAGGLSSGQQAAIAENWIAAIRGMHRKSLGRPLGNAAPLKPEESVEVWRLLGSLELLDGRLKVDLGNMIVDLMNRNSMQSPREAMVWALGRLGARQPFYGPLNTVVSIDAIQPWIAALLAVRQRGPAEQLALVQLCRRVDDRYRDIEPSTRDEVVDALAGDGVSDHLTSIVAQGGRFSHEEQEQVFGEALPRGLRLG
ncbi:Hsp70 family protein [Rosistilla oblonga]|uniref:hsp70 family protein n=1 Tax=Rosistilla oblonga TaxID=2527990 RepID=UPI003A96923D